MTDDVSTGGKIISIHALLAESDCVVSVQVGGNIYFYPRSPCGERRKSHKLTKLNSKISIHALLAESDKNSGHEQAPYIISIHALLAESDHCDTLSALAPKQFLSTLSLRRATQRR